MDSFTNNIYYHYLTPPFDCNIVYYNYSTFSYNYSQFKKLILDAEKRHLVETKNDNLKWYVRKR